MSLATLTKRLFITLEEHFPSHFAICGGLAASTYRTNPRMTDDLDIAVSGKKITDVEKAAEKTLRAIGATVSIGVIENLSLLSPHSKPLFIGTFKQPRILSSVDILLPSLPWVPNAVERAQHNVISYGLFAAPTLTPEDILIAKIFALMIEPNRFQDLDDIKAISTNVKLSLDESYLEAQCKELGIETWQKILKRRSI